MKKSLLTVFSAVFMFIAAFLAVSCGGGGGGAIAAAGGNNKGKHFGSGTESGSKIQLTSNQLFSGETASMMATTSYDFIRLKVKVNGEEKTYQIQKSQNIELNIGTTIGDKLQMYAEICDASGTVLRTATSDPITVGLGTNNVVMYIIYKAKLHHADGTVTEYPFTSLGSTLPVDTTTYAGGTGYVFNAWASGPSDGTYDGTNASGMLTNSIAPGTRNDVELYAHWKPAPLADGTIPPAKAKVCYYDNPASPTPTRSELYTIGEGLPSLQAGSAASAGGYVAAGATFAGWYPAYDGTSGANGAKVTSIDASQTGNVSLYAKWEYNVTLYNNPLDLNDTTVMTYTKENTPALSNASKPAGWAAANFEGWYTTALSSSGISAKVDGSGYAVSASAVKKTAITPGTDKLYAWFSATATLVYDKCEATGCTELKEEKTFFPGVAYTLPASAAAKTTLTNSTTSALMKYVGSASAVSCNGWYTTFTPTSTSPVDYSKATFSDSISAIPASQKGECTVYAKYTITDVLIQYTLDNYEIFANSSTGFIVSNSPQMNQLVALGKTFSGATITLKSHVYIDNASGGFINFDGTFDGGGYTVSLSNGCSLVRGSLYGTVKNVKTAGTVTNSRAAIAEACGSGGKIESCINAATVTSSSEKVGGICGTLNGGTITGCANTGYITGVTHVGGIVGHSEGGTVEKCYNDVGLKGIGGPNISPGAAGICGYVYGRTTFTNCYVTANSKAVKADGSPVDYWPGSIIGCVSSNYCTISNCYSADPSSDYGGLGRGSSNGSTVTECYKFGAKKSTYADDGTQVFTDWATLNRAPFNTAPWKWDAGKNRPVLIGVGTEGGWAP